MKFGGAVVAPGAGGLAVEPAVLVVVVLVVGTPVLALFVVLVVTAVAGAVERSVSISSESQRTSRSADSRPWR